MECAYGGVRVISQRRSVEGGSPRHPLSDYFGRHRTTRSTSRHHYQPTDFTCRHRRGAPEPLIVANWPECAGGNLIQLLGESVLGLPRVCPRGLSSVCSVPRVDRCACQSIGALVVLGCSHYLSASDDPCARVMIPGLKVRGCPKSSDQYAHDRFLGLSVGPDLKYLRFAGRWRSLCSFFPLVFPIEFPSPLSYIVLSHVGRLGI